MKPPWREIRDNWKGFALLVALGVVIWLDVELAQWAAAGCPYGPSGPVWIRTERGLVREEPLRGQWPRSPRETGVIGRRFADWATARIDPSP